MLRINLLPTSKRQSKILFKPAAALIAGCTVVLVACMVAIFMWQWLSMERQFVELHNHYMLLKPVEIKMQQLYELKQKENERADVLIKMSNDRQSMTALLSSLASAAPNNVWFSEVTNQSQSSGGDKGMEQIRKAEQDMKVQPLNTDANKKQQPQQSAGAPTENPAVPVPLVIRGTAADFNAVASLLDNMGGYPLLKNATLGQASENVNGRGIAFEIIIAN